MSRHIWHSAVQPKQVVYGKGSHYNILQVTDSGGRSPRSRRSHMSKWIISEANAHPRTLQHVSTRVPLNAFLLQSVVRRCILQLQKQMSTQFLPRFQRDVHASHRESFRRLWQLLEGGEESVMCGMISSLSNEYSIYFNLL